MFFQASSDFVGKIRRGSTTCLYHLC